MEHIAIHTHVQRQDAVVKFIRADEMSNFYNLILLKHRQSLQCKLTSNQIVAAINLTTNRLLRMSGKAWDQLATEQHVWLVTTAEWDEYCERIQDQEQLFRHGKKIVSRHPGSLSYERFTHFIAQFYEGTKPVDPLRRFALPPPTTPSMKSPMMTPLAALPSTSTNQKKQKKSSPDAKPKPVVSPEVRNNLFPKRQSSPTYNKNRKVKSPQTTEKALIQAVKAALQQQQQQQQPPVPSSEPRMRPPQMISRTHDLSPQRARTNYQFTPAALSSRYAKPLQQSSQPAGGEDKAQSSSPPIKVQRKYEPVIPSKLNKVVADQSNKAVAPATEPISLPISEPRQEAMAKFRTYSSATEGTFDEEQYLEQHGYHDDSTYEGSSVSDVTIDDNLGESDEEDNVNVNVNPAQEEIEHQPYEENHNNVHIQSPVADPKFELLDDSDDDSDHEEVQQHSSNISSVSDHQDGYVENKIPSTQSPIVGNELNRDEVVDQTPEQGPESPQMKQARLFAELNVELGMIIKEGRQKSAEKNMVEKDIISDSPNPVSNPFTPASVSVFDEESRDATFNISDMESDYLHEDLQTSADDLTLPAMENTAVASDSTNEKPSIEMQDTADANSPALVSPYNDVSLEDIIEKVKLSPKESTSEEQPDELMNGDLDLVDIAKDSPTNIGAEQKSSPVDNEANKALREMIQKQAQELEQEKKARVELEARLDEARYLLKIIASGPRLADPEQNNTSVSAINDTITELELALNKIEIKEEPAQPALKIPHPISISNPHYADEDSNDSAYDSNGKHGVKSYSKSPRRRANGHSPKKSQKTPIRHSDFVTSPNSAKIAPIEKYQLQESPENYNSQSKSNNTDGEDAAASDNYASDNNGSTFITQYVSLKAKKDNKTPIAENATMSEGEEQLQGYSDLLPSPSHEQSKAASQANKYSPDQEDSFEKIDSEESPKSSKVTFLTDMTVSDDSPLTVPKSSSFLRKVAVLNSHRMANPESQSNDDDIQYEEQDSQEFNSDMEPLKPNKNNRRDSDDFLNGVDEENGKIRKKQRKNLLLDPQEDDDDRSDDSSHYPYAFEKTPKIRVPHRSGSGNLMNFLNSPPSLVPEIVENTNKNKQLGKNALLQEDDSPIANFMEGEESNDDTHDDIFSKDPSVISQEDAVQQILDDLEKENNAALAKAEIVREQDVINDEDLPPPPPKMALPTIDEQPGAEDVSPPPPPPPSILTDLVHDTEEALNESFTDEYVNIEPENNAEGEDGELPPPPPIQSEPSPIESPEDIQSPEISDIHAEADIDNVPPPKFSEEPNTPMPNTASLSTNPQTPSNVIRPINEVVQYIDTSLREDIISPLSVSISSDVEESNATSPVMGDHKSNLALLKERIGTRTPLNQSTDRSYNFTTPPPQDITQIAPDSAHARDLDMQFDTTLDNDLSDSMIKDDNNVNNAVYNTTYTAPLDDRGANYHEDIDINIPLDLPALDPFLSLISYYRPFLIAAKYCDSRSALRGTKAYFSVVNTSVSLGSAIGISADEMLLWVIFQLYGNPTEGGIISRLIKTTHLSRALKEAKVGNVTSSQLDLYLVKVHAKLAANPGATVGGSSSNTSNTPVMTKTGTILSSPSMQRNTRGPNVINANPKVDPSMLNGASFIAYLELLKVLYQGVTDQHGRGRGGIIAATFTYEKMRNCFMDLLKGRDLTLYNKMYLEYQFSLSGVLGRGVYNKFVMSPKHARYREWLTQARRFNLLIYSEQDIDLVRQIWERNSEQIRLIYLYYANTVETRRIGNGPVQLMMSLENCKDMLQDFEVLPQLIDVQSFNRLFRSCKLWEWDLADCLIRSNGRKSLTNDNASVADNNVPDSGKSIVSGVQSFLPSSRSNAANPDDPLDMRSTVGHYSITLFGFIECITRIACYQNKLSDHPHISLENMMHLMDASPGKSKMLRSANTRKSVSVRHFVYNTNSANNK